MRGIRTAVRSIVAAVALVGLVLPTAASAVERSEQFDFVRGGGANPLAESFTIDARNETGSPRIPASGYFAADSVLVQAFNVGVNLDLAGPVVCLHVRGNRAGLIYAVTRSDPPVPPGQGIYLSFEDNGPDRVDRVNAAGPAPITRLPGCLPTPGTLPIDGDVVVHDAR